MSDWVQDDTVEIFVWLEQTDGTRIVFADYSAFTAAGWTAEHLVDGSADASPGFSLAHIGTVGQWDEGLHRMTLSAEKADQSAEVIIRPPTGTSDRHALPAVTWIGKVGTYDRDAIQARLLAVAGQPVIPDRVTAYDFEVTEGAIFSEEITIPQANLDPIDETDLTDATIAITMAIRAAASQFSAAADAPEDEVYVIITDAANRTVRIGWPVFPSGLALGAVPADDGTQVDSVAYRYDLDVAVTKSYAVTAVDTAADTVTVGADVRRWIGKNSTITITGSTGNDGSYPITGVSVSAGSTVISTSGDIANATADGNVEVTVSCAPVEGQITVLRQEHR